MAGTRLTFDCATSNGSDSRDRRIDHLVIAGWTGRDQAAIQAHIEELAALGVPRPATTPIFYRVAAALLSTDDVLEVSGNTSSGEVEPVLVALEDGLWVGVGSDHTDRQAETVGITLAKQLCAKAVSPTLWRFADLAGHWDQLILRSYAVVGGSRRLYQEGTAALMLRPEDLIKRYTGKTALPGGTVMFCGTMAVKGGIAPADSFEMELEDPVLKRTIRHAYRVVPLPVAG